MTKTILVGADLNSNKLMDYYMKELENLAKASNLNVVYTITQSIKGVNPVYYIGSGKVEEIQTFVENLDAELIIFNNELSGSQIRNLEREIGCQVIDRTMLILDIFARRASTKEAMLQVEIAQLEYLRPRLIGLTSSLNRQQGGIGSRGPGEKQLELDKRKLDHEKSKLLKELDEIVKSRKIQRKTRSRSAIKKVAIVGYTNAGKSTLLNKLIEVTSNDDDKQVFEKDMLFATLETSTRHITLADHKNFIVTDTVGFVSNLPHHLIESFKSTLEEITEADYLIHVVDASNENYDTQIEITTNTLEEIGVHDIPTLYIYNKSDLIDYQIQPTNFPSIVVSLISENGIQKVIDFISIELFKDYETVTMLIPFNEGDLVSYLNEHNPIIKQEYNEKGTILTLEINELQKNKYATYIKKDLK